MYAIVSYEYIRLDLRMFSHLFFSSFYLFTPDSFTHTIKLAAESEVIQNGSFFFLTLRRVSGLSKFFARLWYTCQLEGQPGSDPVAQCRETHISQQDGVRIAQVLLEYGADINTQDNNHETLLDSPSHHGKLEIASIVKPVRW